jgi:hypothetical protein
MFVRSCQSGPRTVAAVAFAAVLAGCAASVPIRSQGSRVQGAGAESVLVFTTPEVRSVLGDQMGDEASRQDWRMYARQPESSFDQLAFPQATAPTLDRSRRLWLGSSTPDLYLYFQRTKPYEQELRWRSRSGR